MSFLKERDIFVVNLIRLTGGILVQRSPKSSTVGKFDLALSGYNALKLKSLSKEFETNNQELSERLEKQAELQTKMYYETIERLEFLQIYTMSGMVKIQSDITSLQGSMNSIEARLDRMEIRDEFLSRLRLSLLGIETEIEKISEIETLYPEYAAYMAECLQELVVDLGLKPDDFKYLSMDEIKKANSILSNVSSKREETLSRLLN